jgi:hypothetical protein
MSVKTPMRLPRRVAAHLNDGPEPAPRRQQHFSPSWVCAGWSGETDSARHSSGAMRATSGPLSRSADLDTPDRGAGLHDLAVRQHDESQKKSPGANPGALRKCAARISDTRAPDVLARTRSRSLLRSMCRSNCADEWRPSPSERSCLAEAPSSRSSASIPSDTPDQRVDVPIYIEMA